MVNVRRLLVLVFFVTVGLGLQTSAHVQPTSPSPIVGTWELVTRTVSRGDGTSIVDPVLGEKPTGRLVYDASGTMTLQMMRAGRKAAIAPPAVAPDKASPRGYDSYFGRYTVDDKAGTVTHHVQGSLSRKTSARTGFGHSP